MVTRTTYNFVSEADTYLSLKEEVAPAGFHVASLVRPLYDLSDDDNSLLRTKSHYHHSIC